MQLNSTSGIQEDVNAVVLVPQSMITLTEEALRLRTQGFLEQTRKRSAYLSRFWGLLSTSAGLFLTFLTSSSFKNFLLSGEQWAAVFGCAIVCLVGAALYNLICFCRTEKPRDLVDGILEDSRQTKKTLPVRVERAPDWMFNKPESW